MSRVRDEFGPLAVLISRSSHSSKGAQSIGGASVASVSIKQYMGYLTEPKSPAEVKKMVKDRGRRLCGSFLRVSGRASRQDVDGGGRPWPARNLINQKDTRTSASKLRFVRCYFLLPARSLAAKSTSQVPARSADLVGTLESGPAASINIEQAEYREYGTIACLERQFSGEFLADRSSVRTWTPPTIDIL